MDIFREVDIPPAQLCAIMMLFRRGASRSCDIGKELKVAPPTATGIIGRLAKAGYVNRSASKEDRRVVVVALTRRGHILAARLSGIVVQRWTELLSRISRGDAEKYVEILKKISEAV